MRTFFKYVLVSADTAGRNNMVYRPASEQVRLVMNHENGVKFAREAKKDGNYALAWKHAQAYGLDALDLLELGLPEKFRPRGFNPGMPKAMGCVR